MAEGQDEEPCAAVLAGNRVAHHRLAAYRERLLDASERPSESPQGEDLLLALVQDVAHADDGTCVPPPRQRLDRYCEWLVFSGRSMAGLECLPRWSREWRPAPDIEIVTGALLSEPLEVRPDPDVQLVSTDLGEFDDICQKTF